MHFRNPKTVAELFLCRYYIGISEAKRIQIKIEIRCDWILKCWWTRLMRLRAKFLNGKNNKIHISQIAADVCLCLCAGIYHPSLTRPEWKYSEYYGVKCTKDTPSATEQFIYIKHNSQYSADDISLVHFSPYHSDWFHTAKAFTRHHPSQITSSEVQFMHTIFAFAFCLLSSSLFRSSSLLYSAILDKKSFPFKHFIIMAFSVLSNSIFESFMHGASKLEL